MKLDIDKIHDHELKEKYHLSDNLLRFKLDLPDLYDQLIALFREKAAGFDENYLKHLDREIVRNGYEMFGDRDTLIRKDLQHLFKADYYYTNGQKIVTLVFLDDKYEIGTHKSLDEFAIRFNRHYPMSQFSLSHVQLPSFGIFEKTEAEISRILSELSVQRIPTMHDSNTDYLEIMKYYPFKYAFRYNNRELHKQVTLANSYAEISADVIEWLKPVVLKCCRNCKQFEYSGMALDMGGGAAGYCRYWLNQPVEISHGETLTHIWNWCGRFEKK